MNRKGFTLIELLMVIVIIAILSAILIPNVMAIINKNKQNSIDSLEKSIISATKEYVSDNKYNLSFNCPNINSIVTKSIPLSVLVNGGYIKGSIKNPNTKEDIALTKVVNVKFNCKTKTFSYEFEL